MSKKPYKLPTSEEVKKSMKEYVKSFTSTMNPTMLEFEDPYYSQPLAKAPVERCNLRGEFKV